MPSEKLIEVPAALIETPLALEIEGGDIVADTLDGRRCDATKNSRTRRSRRHPSCRAGQWSLEGRDTHDAQMSRRRLQEVTDSRRPHRCSKSSDVELVI
jgi:hypothetical protein